MEKVNKEFHPKRIATESYEVKFTHMLPDGSTKDDVKILKFFSKVEPRFVESEFMLLYRSDFVWPKINSIKYQ
jgi:hypothetical protein